MEIFTAIYTDDGIVVPTEAEADSLLQDGYGYRWNKVHYLHGVEVLYNMERGKIQVVDEETNTQLSFQGLLRRLSRDDPDLWTRYTVYRDLRRRGFIIKIQRGFKVYERGDFGKKPPSYHLKIISEGKPERVEDVLEELASVEAQQLGMKVAVVDRRGEIVYYGVKEKKL